MGPGPAPWDSQHAPRARAKLTHERGTHIQEKQPETIQSLEPGCPKSASVKVSVLYFLLYTREQVDFVFIKFCVLQHVYI